MSKKNILLYASSSTWLAVSSSAALAPVSGNCSDPLTCDWKAVGQSLLKHFAVAGKVRLVLSARQCRFMVAPWVSTCYTGASIKAYVTNVFTENLGVTGQSHRIEIHWPQYGQPILAVAYPRALVDAIQAGLAAAGHELSSIGVSVEPILRRYGKSLGSDPALLAYAEDDGITGITIEGGQVAQVETLSGQGPGLEDVAVWSSRKRFGFADDAAMRWLATAAKPEAFAGTTLALTSVDKPATPGHAVVATCL